MADSTVHSLTDGTTPAGTDEFYVARSPFGSGDDRKLTWTEIAAAVASSVFGRTGAVVAASGDYLASQVTNAADKIATSVQSFAGGIASTHATQGVGYATGAGGAVTQATSRTTAVTLNKITGQITTFNSSMVTNATAFFTVNNSAVAIGDVVLVSCQNDAQSAFFFPPFASKVQAGTFVISYANNSSATVSTAFVFNFVVIKAVAS